MALVTTKEMFKKAYEGGYAIGAFNINNMEIIQAITEAAAEEKSPVILQVSAGARKYAKHAYLMALAKAAVEDSGVDLVYSVCVAEDDARKKRANCGAPLKLGGNLQLAAYVERRIIQDRWSPAAVSADLRRSDLGYLCEDTIYRYIHRRIFATLQIGRAHV